MAIGCLLMDVEGTIVPIAFVRHTLFPYARRRLAAFLRERREDPAVRRWTALCQDTAAAEQGAEPTDDELPGMLHRWMEEDRKHPGLKGLQGMIWEEGYRTGAFSPELYPDVVPALRSWSTSGLHLAMYSSGSEPAQRLLVRHTTEGDLEGLFSGFFDTSVGIKTEPDAYRRIAAALHRRPDGIRFLSDVEGELDAAAAAGLETTQIVRPGTRPGNRHPVVYDFGALIPNHRLQSTAGRSQP
jgi:enolase-phosphatase E1